MGIAIVQAVGFTARSTYPATASFTSNVTVGNRLICMFAHTDAGCPPSVSDSLGNTWEFHGTQLSNVGMSNLLEVFSAFVTTAGVCTVHPTAACGGMRDGVILEVAGLDYAPYDGENAQINTSSPISTNTIPTTADGELLLGMFIVPGGTPTITPTNGGLELVPSPGLSTQIVYRIAGAAGNGNFTATAVGSDLTSFPIQGFIAAFKGVPGDGYKYRRTLTVDHTKVSGSLSNFPLLVSGTYPYLATVTNGGRVQNSNGYDIIFCSGSDGATKLYHEIEYYDATTGGFIAHVRATSLTDSADTPIYLFYGNSTVSTTQENSRAVWDSNYKLVIHMSDNAPSTAAQDSTGLGSVTAERNTNLLSTNTRIGKGFTFVPASHDDLKAAQNGNFSTSGGVTAEVWAYVTNTAAQNAMRVVSFYDAGGSVNFQLGFNGVNNAYVKASNSAGAGHDQEMTATLSAGFHHIVGTWSGDYADGNAGFRLYVDGVMITSFVERGYGVYEGDSTIVYIGQRGDAPSIDTYFGGFMDELRISTGIVRPVSWIWTEYNNQSSPRGFYSFSSETQVGGFVVANAAIYSVGGARASLIVSGTKTVIVFRK